MCACTRARDSLHSFVAVKASTDVVAPVKRISPSVCVFASVFSESDASTGVKSDKITVLHFSGDCSIGLQPVGADRLHCRGKFLSTN